MTDRTFFTANVIGAAIWAVGISLLGYTLGSQIGADNIDHYLLPIVAVIIVLSLIPPFLEWRKHKRTSRRRDATSERWPRTTKSPAGSPATFDRAVQGATKLGISVWGSRVLRVKGRTTGEIRTVPVNLLTVDGTRYLVAPRGETQWVRNLRALPTATASSARQEDRGIPRPRARRRRQARDPAGLLEALESRSRRVLRRRQRRARPSRRWSGSLRSTPSSNSTDSLPGRRL